MIGTSYESDEVSEVRELRDALGAAYDVLCTIYALEPLSKEGAKFVKEQGDRIRAVLEASH